MDTIIDNNFWRWRGCRADDQTSPTSACVKQFVLGLGGHARRQAAWRLEAAKNLKPEDVKRFVTGQFTKQRAKTMAVSFVAGAATKGVLFCAGVALATSAPMFVVAAAAGASSALARAYFFDRESLRKKNGVAKTLLTGAIGGALGSEVFGYVAGTDAGKAVGGLFKSAASVLCNAGKHALSDLTAGIVPSAHAEGLVYPLADAAPAPVATPPVADIPVAGVPVAPKADLASFRREITDFLTSHPNQKFSGYTGKLVADALNPHKDVSASQLTYLVKEISFQQGKLGMPDAQKSLLNVGHHIVQGFGVKGPVASMVERDWHDVGGHDPIAAAAPTTSTPATPAMRPTPISTTPATPPPAPMHAAVIKPLPVTLSGDRTIDPIGATRQPLNRLSLDFMNFIKSLSLKDKESGFYVFGGLNNRPGAFDAGAGYQFNSYFGVQGEVMGEGGQPFHIRNVNRLVGLEVVVRQPLGPDFIFGKNVTVFEEVGTVTSRFGYNGSGNGYHNNTGFSGGTVAVGVSYEISDPCSITAKIGENMYPQVDKPKNETYFVGFAGFSCHFN